VMERKCGRDWREIAHEVRAMSGAPVDLAQAKSAHVGHTMRTKTGATTRDGAMEKFVAYETLATFNQGFAQILQSLYSLAKLGFLQRGIFTGLQTTLEETVLLGNFKLSEIMGVAQKSRSDSPSRCGVPCLRFLPRCSQSSVRVPLSK
jgi:hypothetical protein